METSRYSYRIKVIDGKRKKPATRQLYRLSGVFKSISDMKRLIGTELKENIAKSDIGYFEGKYSTKRWLVVDEDLAHMYSNIRSGEIHLWCDMEVLAEVEEPPPSKKNKGGSRREDKEARVDEVHQELLKKHQDKFTTYQLSLWARMIVNKLHFSYDEPPNQNPLITGAKVPNPRNGTLVEAITVAGTAIAKAVTPAAPKTPPLASAPNTRMISPGRSADIRLKNLEQLKCLQQLYEDKVLTEEEFKEQKTIILEALRKL